MGKYFSKTGAVLFALWGIIHVVGGAMMLSALNQGGAVAYLAMTTTGVAPEILSTTPDLVGVNATLGMHAWNLTWIGALVFAVAVTLNWRNRVTGFWVNLALVSGADIGLLAFMIVPGVMRLQDGLPGLVLWLPATVFAALGLSTKGRSPSGSEDSR